MYTRVSKNRLLRILFRPFAEATGTDRALSAYGLISINVRYMPRHYEQQHELLVECCARQIVTKEGPHFHAHANALFDLTEALTAFYNVTPYNEQQITDSSEEQ